MYRGGWERSIDGVFIQQDRRVSVSKWSESEQAKESDKLVAFSLSLDDALR